MDDEVEKIKAVKIAQIKEQQSKQCPLCYSTAIQHRLSSPGAEQKFAYKCCQADCHTDNLKTARAFNQHMLKHGESQVRHLCNAPLHWTGLHWTGQAYEPASRVCPLCFRPRIEHKNRCLSDEDKGSHRGNLYKVCVQCTVILLYKTVIFLVLPLRRRQAVSKEVLHPHGEPRVKETCLRCLWERLQL